jgi:hypothetical protein
MCTRHILSSLVSFSLIRNDAHVLRTSGLLELCLMCRTDEEEEEEFVARVN